MRKDEFNEQVNEAIHCYIDSQSTELFTNDLIDKMNLVWLERAEDENDWRSGEDTYGYGDSHSLLSNMIYISDRWRCAFRMRWILDGLQMGRF